MPAAQDYWFQILTSLKGRISASNYQSWLSGLEFENLEADGQELVLGVPSKFNQNYIESKFLPDILETAGKYYTKLKNISFVVKKESKTTAKMGTRIGVKGKKGEGSEEAFFEAKGEQDGEGEVGENLSSGQNQSYNQSSNRQKIGENSVLKLNQSLHQKPSSRNLHGLNHKYNFESYVITPHNELATSVAQRVAMEPGQKYNPLFIYSEVGLGKTHLLQAIGHKALEIHPSMKIRYITSECFVNEYIQSIQKKTTKEFSDYYRSIDLLLVDDIQFIAGKEATQEGFFHTFNELHQNNKQVVLTSDKHPKSLGGIEARLVSRFEWGIVIDISKPELEAREAIIRDKATRMNLNLTIEQVARIATKVNTNFRDMEGVLNRIQASIQLLPGRPFNDLELDSILTGSLAGSGLSSAISININNGVGGSVSNQGQFSQQFPGQYSNQFANQFGNIENSLIQNNYGQKNPENVIDMVCRVFEISKLELMGKGREKNVALARQVAMYICKKELRMSFPAIGKFFGRDHSTAMHGYNLISKSLQNGDLMLTSRIEAVKSMV